MNLQQQSNKQLIESVCWSLDNHPNEWYWKNDGFYTIIMNQTGLEICLIGEVYIDAPYKVKFGFWERRPLVRAVKRWKKIRGEADRDRILSKNAVNSYILLTRQKRDD